MLDYTFCRNYLNLLSKKGSDFTILPVKILLNKLGNPEEKLNIIHIAGTNGKGSTVTYLSNILVKAGFNVGTFMSPAVFYYNEMFKINNIAISNEDFCQCFNKIYPILNELQNEYNFTSYMIETVICYLYFYSKNVDFCIVECGLGGKCDATNVEKSNLFSILTSISLDHTQILGNLEQITENKCGIIRNTVITTIANKDVMHIIKSHANNVIVTDNSTSKIVDSSQEITYKNNTYLTKMLGEYQKVNLPLAIEGINYLKTLGYNIPNNAILEGILDAKIEGRFEQIATNPTFIIDGCHNPNASLYLQNYIKNKKNFTLIIGIFKDKDYNQIIANTTRYAKKIYTFDWDNPRKLGGMELKKQIEKYNKNVEYTTLKDAVVKAQQDKDTTIIAFGSLSFLKEIKQEVQNDR